MKKLRFFAILFIFSNIVKAQNIGLTGWVFNKQTLETIPGAIVVDSKTAFYTEATEQGYYQTITKKGVREIVYAAPGFKTLKLNLELEKSTVKNVFLVPVDYDELDSSEEFTSLYNDKASFYKVLPRQIKQGTSIFSLSDPIKLVQYLPGVVGGIEGLSSLYVRGSNSDQNLILMNGLPLYGNGHIFGLISNFNPEIIKNCDFYRGVAPARYGNRAGGGVLDIQTIGGSAENWSGSVNIDVATFNVALNGPIDYKGRWTTSLAFRRSYFDLIFSDLFSNFLIGNIHDINFKLDFKQDSKNHWNYWIYNGRDKYGINISGNRRDSVGRTMNYNISLGASWQNTLSGLNYSHVFNAKNYMHLSAGFSRYSYTDNLNIGATIYTDTSISEVKQNIISNSSITDYSLNADFFNLWSNDSKLRYGAQMVVHNMNPSLLTYQILNSQNSNSNIDTIYGTFNNQTVSELTAYAEIEYKPFTGMSMNIGGRIWNYISSENNYLKFEPRIILSQLLEGKKRIQFGFATSNQGIHQLSSVSGNLPQDIWFPTTGNFRPQTTNQFTIGYSQPAFGGMEASLEYYYKSFDGITELSGFDGDILQKSYWENSILQGTGSSTGLEFLISKKSGPVNGILSYTFSVTDRQFEELNNGKAFDFRWDRRNKISLQMTYQVSNDLVFNMSGVFMDGHAVTVPTSKYYTTDNRQVYDYSEKNNYRMPFYKRIDIGFTKEIKPEFHDDYHEYYGIHVYNLFGWDNPVVARFGENNLGSNTLVGISYFKFIPSAFYRIEF